MSARRRIDVTNLLIKLAVCIAGAAAVNMTRILGDKVPPLLGLPLGTGGIQPYPCIGWILFSALPLACFAIETHASVSAFGYEMLMRHGSYRAWRMRNYSRAVSFCAIYATVTLLSQLVIDAEYVTVSGTLARYLVSASLFWLMESMLCAVFQWLYLQTMRGETVVLLIISLNAVGIALGYTLPNVALFIPISWAMFARSGLYSNDGYSIIITVILQIVIICAAMLTTPRLQASIFMPRDQQK